MARVCIYSAIPSDKLDGPDSSDMLKHKRILCQNGEAMVRHETAPTLLPYSIHD